MSLMVVIFISLVAQFRSEIPAEILAPFFVVDRYGQTDAATAHPECHGIFRDGHGRFACIPSGTAYLGTDHGGGLCIIAHQHDACS